MVPIVMVVYTLLPGYSRRSSAGQAVIFPPSGSDDDGTLLAVLSIEPGATLAQVGLLMTSNFPFKFDTNAKISRKIKDKDGTYEVLYDVGILSPHFELRGEVPDGRSCSDIDHPTLAA